MSETIEDLLRRHAAGDATALEAIMERIQPWVRSQVRRRLGAHLRDKMDSQDVAQDAVYGFLRDAPGFIVSNDAALFALLSRIIERVVLTHDRYFHRKRRDLARERPLAADSSIDLTEAVPAHGEGPVTAAGRTEEESLTRLALEMLDPVEQRIVCMRCYDEASYVGIAAALQMSEDAVRKRFNRAMPKLAERVTCLRERDIEGFVGGAE